MVKKFLGPLVAAALALAPIAALAQAGAQLNAGYFWGNPNASRAPGQPASVTQMLDQALGNTRGAIIERGTSAWVLQTPGTAGRPYVTGGPGVDGSYAVLGIVGGGTNCSTASGTCLDNITGFSTTGMMSRTGAGTYTFTTLGTGVLTALGVNVGAVGSFVVNGGALGTPSSGTLTNATGLPIAGIAGLGTGVGTWLATPSSANLGAALTTKTGSAGLVVFDTSPTISNPTFTGNINTPLAANLPVIGGGAGSPLASGTRSGNTTNFATVTGSFTTGDCIQVDANGNHIDSGNACPGPASGADEIIFNKAVQVDQTWEGTIANCDGTNNPQTGASQATETYGPDGWRLGCDIGIGRWTGQRLNVAAVPGLPFMLKCLTTTIDGTAAVGSHYHLEVPVEGPRILQLKYGTASAQSMTVQFWFASSINGTYSFGVTDGGNTQSYNTTFVYSGGGVPQQYKITIAPATTGSWNVANGTFGLKFFFDFGSGSNFETSTNNAWQAGFFIRTASTVKMIATLSANFLVTGFQADVGTVAQPYRFKSYDYDLSEAQYYYAKTMSDGQAVISNAGGNGSLIWHPQIAGTTAGGGAVWRFPKKMSASPAMVYFSPGAAGASWYNFTAVAASGVPATEGLGSSGVFVRNPQVAGDAVAAITAIHAVANNRLGGF